jgi:hypothetical protein
VFDSFGCPLASAFDSGRVGRVLDGELELKQIAIPLATAAVGAPVGTTGGMRYQPGSTTSACLDDTNPQSAQGLVVVSRTYWLRGIPHTSNTAIGEQVLRLRRQKGWVINSTKPPRCTPPVRPDLARPPRRSPRRTRRGPGRSPRRTLTRALRLLLDELNSTPSRIPGDPRPITYQLRST